MQPKCKTVMIKNKTEIQHPRKSNDLIILKLHIERHGNDWYV